MGGTRHGRNCTNHAQFSYHERQRAKRDGKYGTRTARVGRDSIRPFDCCAITLKPCRNPVVSKQGYVFEREAILEYIVTHRTTFKRNLKEWEKQKKMLEAADMLAKEKAHEKHVTKFLAEETSVTGSRPIFSTTNHTSSETDVAAAVAAKVRADKDKLPTYWMPRDNAAPTMKPKPSGEIKCPLSGQAIKMKDMIPIVFTLIDETSNEHATSDNARYMCPLSRVTLTNATPCVALRSSGKVIAKACVKEFIEKEMVDPFTGDKLEANDIIKIMSDGTGHSGMGATISKVETAVMTVG